MRAFIAIEIKDEIKNELSLLQNQIQEIGKIKIVKAENLHITLKFLGEINEKQKDEIIKKIQSINQKQFDITIGKIGCFPNEVNPKVIWAGLIEGEDKVIELQKQIDIKTCSRGLTKEKKFQPHTTIARVNGKINYNDFQTMLNSGKNKIFGTQKIKSIKLVKSELTSKGAIYKIIFEKTLGKK